MGIMTDAYSVAGTAFRARQEEHAPDEVRRLDESDTVVIGGQYDRAETTLDALKAKFSTIAPGGVGQAEIRPSQTVIVNCPGNLDGYGIEKLQHHVENGGKLVTTDWALGGVVERAFPGFVACGGKNTADDVVSVKLTTTGSGLLGDLVDPEDDPRWWLEGASHPIRVLDPGRVDVLLDSDQMEARYGEPSIVVRFVVGQGVVYHMVSHIYLQRTAERTGRQKAGAAEFLARKGVGRLDAMLKDDQTHGEVEAAFAAVGLMGRILTAPHPGEMGSSRQMRNYGCPGGPRPSTSHKWHNNESD